MPGGVFTVISSIATTSFLFIWATIIVTHLRYLQSNPQERSFKVPGAPYTDYLVLTFLAFVLVVLCLDKQTLGALIFTLIWFAILAVASLSQPRKQK